MRRIRRHPNRDRVRYPKSRDAHAILCKEDVDFLIKYDIIDYVKGCRCYELYRESQADCDAE